MKANEQKRKHSGAAAFKKLTPHGWKKKQLHQSERHPQNRPTKKSRKSVTLLYTTIIAEVF